MHWISRYLIRRARNPPRGRVLHGTRRTAAWFISDTSDVGRAAAGYGYRRCIRHSTSPASGQPASRDVKRGGGSGGAVRHHADPPARAAAVDRARRPASKSSRPKRTFSPIDFERSGRGEGSAGGGASLSFLIICPSWGVDYSLQPICAIAAARALVRAHFDSKREAFYRAMVERNAREV